MPTLTIETLTALPDDAVRDQVVAEFTTQLILAGPDCGAIELFLLAGDVIPQTAIVPVDIEFVRNLSTAFYCSSISLSSQYGFASAINMDAVNAFLNQNMASGSPQAIAEGLSIYKTLFPTYCQKDGTLFQDFQQDDPAGWGQKLADLAKSSAYIDTMVNKGAAGSDWINEAQLTLYKISVLNMPLVAGVIDLWTKALPDQSIAEDYLKRNFIPLERFQSFATDALSGVNQALQQVNAATVNVDTGYSYSLGNVCGWCVENMFLGLSAEYVDEIGGLSQPEDARARRLGFTNLGAPLSNILPATQSSCFVAGTQVRLADGGEVSIEAVAEGAFVLGQGGLASCRTSEQVVTEFAVGVEIYGFETRDGAGQPFFSAGHPFWTQDGWKALDPQMAVLENPDRNIGQLVRGDRVHRLEIAPGTGIQEIEILGFTRVMMGPGTKLYGLHLLEGPRSYFADGYLAAMNYPVLTVERMIKGFGKLTAAERQVLRTHMMPALPMLNAALGPFVGRAVLAALDVYESAKGQSP